MVVGREQKGRGRDTCVLVNLTAGCLMQIDVAHDLWRGESVAPPRHVILRANAEGARDGVSNGPELWDP